MYETRAELKAGFNARAGGKSSRLFATDTRPLVNPGAMLVGLRPLSFYGPRAEATVTTTPDLHTRTLMSSQTGPYRPRIKMVPMIGLRQPIAPGPGAYSLLQMCSPTVGTRRFFT